MARTRITRPIRRGLTYLGPSRTADVLIVLVAVALYAVAWPTLPLTHHVPGALQPVVAAMAVGPFLLLRANPAVGWALSAFGALVIGLVVPRSPEWGLPWQVVHLMVLLALLAAVAVRAPTPLTVVAWASTVVLFLMQMRDGGGGAWAVLLTAWMAVGLLVRRLLLSRRRLAEQEETSELERARRTVLEEKARVARDLHDVVAHHMSMVVVAAQTAVYRLPNISPEAAAEFDAIGATARDALNEVRGILGVLRSDGVDPQSSPAPRAADVVDLLESSRRSGLDVRWTVDGDAAPMSPVTGLVLYRIVQESVANAARHAVGAAIEVRLDYSLTRAALSVVNGPGTSTSSRGRVGEIGHGIAGMHERTTAVGGSVAAAPTPDGGFSVVAHVPMAAHDRVGRSEQVAVLG